MNSFESRESDFQGIGFVRGFGSVKSFSSFISKLGVNGVYSPLKHTIHCKKINTSIKGKEEIKDFPVGVMMDESSFNVNLKGNEILLVSFSDESNRKSYSLEAVVPPNGPKDISIRHQVQRLNRLKNDLNLHAKLYVSEFEHIQIDLVELRNKLDGLVKIISSVIDRSDYKQTQDDVLIGLSAFHMEYLKDKFATFILALGVSAESEIYSTLKYKTNSAKYDDIANGPHPNSKFIITFNYKLMGVRRFHILDTSKHNINELVEKHSVISIFRINDEQSVRIVNSILTDEKVQKEAKVVNQYLREIMKLEPIKQELTSSISSDPLA